MSHHLGTRRLSAPLALAMIITGALVLRLALAPAYARLPDGYLDEWFWASWMFAIHDHGVLNVFRTTEANYVGYQWVLWLLSLVYESIGGAYRSGDVRLHLLVKAPSILSDLALIVAAYHATTALADDAPNLRRLGERRAHGASRAQRLGLLAAAVVAVQPAVVYDSAVWAQTDAAVAAALLASLFLLARGHSTAAWVVWALGMSVKPQAIVILPVLAIATLQQHGPRPLLRGGGAAFATFGVILTPWILHGDTLLLMRAYGALFGSDYGRLSVSAWNGWWLVDQVAALRPSDSIVAPVLTYRLLGLVLSAGAATVSAGYASARRDMRGLLVAGAYLAFAFYMLPVSIHERYLFPVLALLLPVAIVDRRWLWIYAPASLTLFANMFVIAPPIEAWSGRWVDAPFIPLVAVANVAMFAALTIAVARGAAEEWPAFARFVRRSYPFSRFGRRSAEHPPARRAA